MKEKITPLPGPTMPHPMHIGHCMEMGHDPITEMDMKYTWFPNVQQRFCRRCGTLYFQYRETTEARSEGQQQSKGD